MVGLVGVVGGGSEVGVGGARGGPWQRRHLSSFSTFVVVLGTISHGFHPIYACPLSLGDDWWLQSDGVPDSGGSFRYSNGPRVVIEDLGTRDQRILCQHTEVVATLAVQHDGSLIASACGPSPSTEVYFDLG